MLTKLTHTLEQLTGIILTLHIAIELYIHYTTLDSTSNKTDNNQTLDTDTHSCV